ncbi:hypothetical protein HRQ65_07320 [Tatlockia micdadei]|uniref:hypothetical protein n=1 Tax=Legionella micdadei TaxID=451 RepID=UPI00156F2571|nr:hypothetical protein [Legionella micdadei]NSL18190.1 hypothetical protein [Legionella micdadei]
MPREHSELFKGLTQQVGHEFCLNPELVEESILEGEINYGAMSDLLREVNDAQFGIVSTLDNDTNTWLRDATRATLLGQRMSHDAPVIEANNALLRCLSRLRPIDFAIDKKHGAHGRELRDEIKTEFGSLCREILEIAQREGSNSQKNALITQKEKAFNTFLVKQLHEANLTRGCESKKDAEKLLAYYRDLSSVLSPARTMVTLTYDESAHILQRETQYPVTEKTPVQIEALQQLETLIPYPFEDEKNAHTIRNLATQEADYLFAELIAKPDTALPAQARKTHLVGAKNAFIVKNELIQIVDELPPDVDGLEAQDEDVLWLARMGSPAFIGEGEKSEVIQIHTRENLEQVRAAAAARMGGDVDTLNLHVTTLNTYTFSENQSTIIKHVSQATRGREEKSDKMSYMATNPEGTLRALDIAEGLNFGEEEPPHGIAPFQKAKRLKSVSKVILAASNTEDTISVIHCASGQDRTGTAVEKSTQDWMKKRYKSKGLSTRNIESVRAAGGNAAEIASHHVHGSTGMKSDSIANDLLGEATFSPEAQREFYLKSAKTNKLNEVDEVDFLKRPCRFAKDEYEDYFRQFEENLRNSTEPLMICKGNEVIKQVKKIIAGRNPENLDSRSLSDLSLVLFAANKAMRELDDPQKTQENSKRLAALANNVSGKASPKWQALGVALMIFACASLVVVGILAAIPSGGTSLLLSAVGAIGLTASVGVGAGVGAVGFVGTGMFYLGREKGLAKSVSQFKQSLFYVKEESKSAIENPEEKDRQNTDLTSSFN